MLGEPGRAEACLSLLWTAGPNWHVRRTHTPRSAPTQGGATYYEWETSLSRHRLSLHRQQPRLVVERRQGTQSAGVVLTGWWRQTRGSQDGVHHA